MKASEYLIKARAVFATGKHRSDGCTVIGGDFLEKKFNIKEACIAHDLGSRGLIQGIKPGIHNDLHFLKANFHNGNYIWGVIAFLFSTPYTVTFYNLGIKVPMVPFYVTLAFAGLVTAITSGVI